VPPPPIEVAASAPGNRQADRQRVMLDPQSPPRPDDSA
jgi:hypothetical protein